MIATMLPLSRRPTRPPASPSTPTTPPRTRHGATASSMSPKRRATHLSLKQKAFMGTALLMVFHALFGTRLVFCAMIIMALFAMAASIISSWLQQGSHSQRRQKLQIMWTVLLLSTVAGALFGLNMLSQALGYTPPRLVIPGGMDKASNATLTVFLIDGLRADIFEQELEAGNLPNIQKLAQQGCRVKNVAAAFPTITGYAYWPLLTGIEATRSGHLGTRYFDRRIESGNWHNYYGPAGKLLNPDFVESQKTLFESTNGWSLSTNSFVTRGATLKWNTGTEQTFSKALHTWWLAQWLRRLPWIGKTISPTFTEMEAYYMKRIIKIVTGSIRKRPSLVWIVFSGADNAVHALGVGKHYRRTLQTIDAGIGQYVQAVSSSSSSTTTNSFAVISDHGEASVQQGGNLDLCDAYQNVGLRAWRGDSKHWSGKFDEPLESFGADKDVLIGISGDMGASVYVKNADNGWKERTYESLLLNYKTHDGRKVNLIETTLKYTGVQLVAWSRQNGVVAVQTTDINGQVSAVGVITLDKTDGTISYLVEQSDKDGSPAPPCPLGYDASLADGIKRSARQWLELTANSTYPYAVVRLIQCLTVPGIAPDMVVAAHEGYDFGKDWEYYLHNFAGGHGGIHRDHMRVPAIFAGPAVQKNVQVEAATVEDVGASLHVMLQSSVNMQSLDSLQDENDVIAKAAHHASANSDAAQDLLRGKPLSCVDTN